MSCRPSPGLTGPGRAARNGERFDDDGEVTDDHREARITVIIGPGEVKDLWIECDFEPQRLIVDPDALGHVKTARFLLDSVSSILRIPGTLADWRKAA